jgi:energy-coupling factor transport system permease protein
MLYGFETGLILLTLLFLFFTFNRVISPGELVRLTPRAFHDLGVVVLIAMTYIPETARHLERIREAQAIRGHRLRSMRDWRPVIIPLLVGGLERAMNVAEAMVARGYGATAGRRQNSRTLAGLALGLLLLLTGWLLSFWQGMLGWLLLGAGALLLAGLLWRNGRRVVHTRYRPRSWSRQDTLLLLAAVLPLLLIFVPWPFVAQETLAYTPYPRIHLPPFDPVIAFALLLFLLPAVFGARTMHLEVEEPAYD